MTRTGPGSTALAVTTTERDDRPARPHGVHGRADAGFIAHLLATRAAVPEHRAKRRAAPERGAAAYGTTWKLMQARQASSGFDSEA